VNDRPHYPWKQGEELFAEELNAAIANSGAYGPFVPLHANDPVNVMVFGADPSGISDSSAAFNAALALRRNGRPVDVYAPAGTYLLNSPVTVGDSNYAQRLFGQGWSTVLTVGPGFSASALGVILVRPAPYNAQAAQASVCDLCVAFQQPPDFSTTATAGTGVGGTTVTVASVSGVHVGYYCTDSTNSGALPGGAIMPKVTGIAGNVVTLDRPTVGVVTIGDVILFAANRSQAVALSSAPTLNPGAPAIKYPWAIYAVAQSVFIDHVLVTAGWNGVYIRGQSFSIGQYFEGCLNIGLDIDQCFNFPKIEQFMHWGWGIPAAMSGIYYDGQTIAANLGECDGLVCDSLQNWCGIVNLTATWSWGSFSQFSLDGDNANLNIVSTNPNGWLQIGEFYKTGGRNSTNGSPLVLNGPIRASMEHAFFSAGQISPCITVANGSLRISGGYLFAGAGTGNAVITVASGALNMDQMRFDNAASRSDAYLVQTGGSVRVNNSVFLTPPVGGTRAFVLTDSAFNAIKNVAFNTWLFTAPGPLGQYDIPGGYLLSALPASTTYASDAAAAAGGVAVGQLYRNGSVVQIRVT
jgi:hypothetical protein